MTSRSLALALLALAACAPAAAAADPFTLADPCGDADRRVVGAGGSSLTFGAEGGQHDLATTTVRSVGGGIEVAMGLCGDVLAPSTFTRAWSATAGLAENRQLQVALADGPYGTPSRAATVTVLRTVPGLTPNSFETSVEAEHVLAAGDWSAAGRTITFTLRRDALPAAIAEWIAPGTVLDGLRTDTRDGARVTEAGVDDTVIVAGPGRVDSAATNRDFTVE